MAAACAQAGPASPTPADRPALLPFDTFVEEAYQQLLLRDPQLITELGLAAAYGTGHSRLTDVSEVYQRETQALEAALLAELQRYAPADLTPEQRRSADLLAWYLDDLLRGAAFRDDAYLLSGLITTDLQQQLLYLFTELHPINDAATVQAYLDRLAQVDVKLAQLTDGLKRREEIGVVLPRFMITPVLTELRQMAASPPRQTPFYTALAAKLAALPSPSASAKQAWLDTAAAEIEASVLPAYQELADCLERQQAVATDDAGVWKFPDGAAYYAYSLRHHTTTDLTADEINALGQAELDRIQAEMRARFAQLGYPAEASLPELYNRLAREAGFVQGEAIAQAYTELVRAAQSGVAEAFAEQPAARVQVVAGPAGDFYTPPAVDGSRPGLFFARSTGIEARFAMPTLAYHEAVPGHHLQLALALTLPLPSFRRGGLFTAYVEGWALYAERLAWELGFYAADPYGDLGRLQAEALRAARLVVDTGLHARRWTFDQAVEFMLANTGLPRDMVINEVGRYCVWPGQATAYLVGLHKFLDVRQRAQTALGQHFRLAAFHAAVLGQGAVTLDTLDAIVDDYIRQTLAGE